MRRREFITLVGGAVTTWPIASHAQQANRVRRVGVLMNGAATEKTLQSNLAAFTQALSQLGWLEGKNIHIDTRWNAGDAQLARTYAAQLIGLLPDVIVTASTTNLSTVQQATGTIPIVFVQVSDPVAQGFVPNLTRPGGNLTGFSGYEFSIGGKWLDLLKQVAPNLSRVAVVFNPDTSPQSRLFVPAIEAAGPSFGVQAMSAPARNTPELERAIEKFSNDSNGGLIFPTDSFTRQRAKLIAELAIRFRLPTISAAPEFVRVGCLIYYGNNNAELLREQYRGAAKYVDSILKGAKPGELPIQLPTKFMLAINLKTAKVLGLKISDKLIFTADEVIE